MLAAALEEEASGFLGREAPLLAVGDGALGLWSALDAVFPRRLTSAAGTTVTLNVQAKLPKALHCGGEAQVAGDVRCSHAVGVREAARRVRG